MIWIGVGIFIGIILGTVIFSIKAYFNVKEDNQKFDSNKRPQRSYSDFSWPTENWGSPTWQSSKVTIFPQPSQKKAKRNIENELNEAIENEEYEKAAKLRDELTKIKQKAK